MREILFKGFHVDKDGIESIEFNGCKIEGKWVVGAFGDWDNDPREPRAWITPIIDADNYRYTAPYWELIEVIQETVCEYTGLRDKNGRMIFEGDRIIAHEEDGDCEYSIRYKAIQDYPAFDCDPYIDCDSNGLSYLLGAGIGIEVIGTIFDAKVE